tara:strand:+ start:329 stop:625 length:297 start_codon:yes stop_codon:yes gene_type:complete
MTALPPLQGRVVSKAHVSGFKNGIDLHNLDQPLVIRSPKNLPPVIDRKKSPNFDKKLMEELKNLEKEKLAKQKEEEKNTEYGIYFPEDESSDVDSELE